MTDDYTYRPSFITSCGGEYKYVLEMQ